MKYPSNIYEPDPVSKRERPYITFKAKEVKYNIKKDMVYSSTEDILEPKQQFVLPMPTNGLIDSSTNQYDSQNTYEGDRNQSVLGLANKAVQGLSPMTVSGNQVAQIGRLPDPRLTQVYLGTKSRSWTGTWQLMPQDAGESAAIATILRYIKYSAAPDRSKNTKIGVLLQPFVYEIVFSNTIINKAMKFDKMAISSYSIEYFAQGYASTYADLMPKHIQLTMTFEEYGIKTRKDWGEA
jgi:hypothetical protein